MNEKEIEAIFVQNGELLKIKMVQGKQQAVPATTQSLNCPDHPIAKTNDHSRIGTECLRHSSFPD